MAFDLTALAYNFQNRFLYDTGINLGLVDPNAGKFISDLNQKAHSNPFYNALQLVAGGAAAFSGGYVKTAACFVAGTLVATINGFRVIEEIKQGDMVLSADENTLKIGYKPVLETYVRQVDKLIHLTINCEEIISTFDHPYYVKGRGFVNAVDLCIGSELVDNNGNILIVDQIFREDLHDETVDVYNFQVKDNHTYYTSKKKVLVHNANKYNSEMKVRGEKYLNENGDIDWDKWAPNEGRVPDTVKSDQIIEQGTIIDRYGNPYGRYTSPTGTPFEQRALPYENNPDAYHQYEVLKPIENVTSSEIAPAFDMPGGGIQYELPNSIKNLIRDGFLKEI